ncbi:hypothetical protein CROQUDRAFT_104069 [Cronartium quercuum f. sp. fusiforme G11]|uniref:Uncharacterized protein n=1 Tax=Cronartium quercuum f. sp. fusiforme G11 TaxID=708437 RepID=A0A9P6NVK6_9BASI|nr:hypothetical protein CROQUDRAFT_104069 [Cronartium quercuum f. sp. fusiforme G11]
MRLRLSFGLQYPGPARDCVEFEKFGYSQNWKSKLSWINTNSTKGPAYIPVHTTVSLLWKALSEIQTPKALQDLSTVSRGPLCLTKLLGTFARDPSELQAALKFPKSFVGAPTYLCGSQSFVLLSSVFKGGMTKEDTTISQAHTPALINTSPFVTPASSKPCSPSKPSLQLSSPSRELLRTLCVDSQSTSIFGSLSWLVRVFASHVWSAGGSKKIPGRSVESPAKVLETPQRSLKNYFSRGKSYRSVVYRRGSASGIRLHSFKMTRPSPLDEW